MTWTPASSSLNFLAGICAGAGINMITSVATGPESLVTPARIALDAGLWVLAAAFLTWAGQVVQQGERDADLEIAPDFTERERREVRQAHQSGALRRARLPLGLTLAAVLGAVAMLPRLVDWGALF